MRTTLNLDDDLLRRAKQRAAKLGQTLSRFIEKALRLALEPQKRPARPFRLTLLTKKGRLIPGVNLEDRDSLYERMEGRS